MSDRYDTAARREAVLAAWRSSPTRFREDANAEEDLVLGGYADRLIVELAQNASDAAVRAGIAGELRLTLVDRVLSAANTGAALDAEGVDGLTSLRASGKRDEQSSTGRFGIGFAATLAVSDEPEIRSTTGGIRFSLADTDKAVRELGGAAAAELDRRDGRAPVLRLAWPAPGAPMDGYATEVRLPLRDDAALAAVRAALDSVPASLLLALPTLSTVDVNGRVLRRTEVDEQTVALADGEKTRHWRYVTTAGDLPVELLADRPVEERIRQAWRVTAAVPLTEAGEPAALDAAQVLYAPTPTDERISLPVRLIGTFPTSPDRRRVPDSAAVTRFLAEQAAEAVADLIAGCSEHPAVLRLLPGPDLPLSTVDSLVRAAVDAQLRTAVWLPDTHGQWLPPSRALVVDDPLVEIAADVLDGILPAGWWTSATAPALRALGVRRLGLAEVVEAFAGADGEPSWWHDFYDAIDIALRHDPSTEIGEVAAIRVPLVDGRTVTGAREVLLPVDDLPAEAVAALGLRIAHPDAAHPLLARLGAREASPASVLADDRVRAEVEQSYELDDPAPVAEAVLALVAATGIGPGELPWLADLALPDAEGDWRPAGELLLPGAPLAWLIGADVPFGTADRQLVEDYGADVLAAVGTLATFAVVDQPDLDLSDVDDWRWTGRPTGPTRSLTPWTVSRSN
ncbi:sacsin N-terminal ATP-binding-like domain-containing protein [Fodinicola feengrottensis]|uniref:sacsin N-terminal ATP-binding-like domain-containing protein n=1 Tax=Fodinicola feengrottensis TaxID=435914 RepID=UPI0013D16C26|nr:hypothetical protein [Fodinicola feengrottensis]